jgi:alpha-tubulin suppressor-like RCC1 family protein
VIAVVSATVVAATAVPALAVPTPVAAAATTGVFGWGINGQGQIGDGTIAERHVPVPVFGSTANVRQVVSADRPNIFLLGFSVALQSDGTVLTWGDNQLGELGDGTTDPHVIPRPVLAVRGMPTFRQIDAEYGHVVARGTDGSVWTWGRNAQSELGYATAAAFTTVPARVPGLSGIVQVAAGQGTSLALDANGAVWSWGQNLGDGSVQGHTRTTPGMVPGLGTATQVAAGGHSMALLTDNTVWAWGNNAVGQIGDGSTDYRFAPVQVPNLTGVTQIAAGAAHSLAVAGADHSVWAWGDDFVGELGDGYQALQQTRPIHIALAGVNQISAGANISLAVLANGTLFVWGQNARGEGGNDSIAFPDGRPAQVLGLTGVTQASAGAATVLAVAAQYVRPILVPNVLGLSLVDAEDQLLAAGLAVGTETPIDDGNHCVPTNRRVITVRPSVGFRVALGTAINLEYMTCFGQ